MSKEKRKQLFNIAVVGLSGTEQVSVCNQLLISDTLINHKSDRKVCLMYW